MRVGTVCYAYSQGLGMLARSFYDAGVVNEVLIYHQGSKPIHTEWYPTGTPVVTKPPFDKEIVRGFLDKIDVLLCFETPFDWSILKQCQERKIKTVLIPMMEWYSENPPYQFDKFINPSLLDQEYFPHGTFIPIPAPQGTWKQRTTALKFLHNAGNIGSRGHKGTLELMQAVEHVKSDFQLTIRCQDTHGLRQLIEKVPGIENESRVQFQFGEVPYAELFDRHDVYVAPEKYNGLSLPLQEARAAGLLVMASDRFPANTWLPTWPLIKVSSTQRVQAASGHLPVDESVIDPKDIAACIDQWYGRDITAYSLSGRDWAEATSWSVLRDRYLEVLNG
jgi:hypothetical protein